MFELPPPQDDGLYIPTVGDWSQDKHWFLTRYIDAFTTSMRNKRWKGLHYIDLFAGAGIERLKTSQKLNWGSPMIAAKAPHSFSRLHLCEKNKRKYDALVTRVSKIEPNSQMQRFMGSSEKCLTGLFRLPFLTLMGYTWTMRP